MLFSAFFSGMEIAFVSSNRMLAEMDREKHGISQKALDIFYQHPSNFVSTMLVGNNIALVIRSLRAIPTQCSLSLLSLHGSVM